MAGETGQEATGKAQWQRQEAGWWRRIHTQEAESEQKMRWAVKLPTVSIKAPPSKGSTTFYTEPQQPGPVVQTCDLCRALVTLGAQKEIRANGSRSVLLKVDRAVEGRLGRGHGWPRGGALSGQ